MQPRIARRERASDTRWRYSPVLTTAAFLRTAVRLWIRGTAALQPFEAQSHFEDIEQSLGGADI